MTKLFVQLFLSVVVGASVGLSLKSSSKVEVRQKILEAGAALHETVNATVQNIGDLTARVDAAISAKAETKASSEALAEKEIKAKSGMNMNAGGGFPIYDAFLSDISIDDTFEYKSRTNIQAELPGKDIELTEKTNSSLDLKLDMGE